MKQSLTLTHGNGYRNYGRTNGARQEQERQICSLALFAVQIVGKSCTTAQVKTLKRGKNHFVCSTSKLKGKEVCPRHFIRAVVLEQGVPAHIRLTIACVANHEEQFRKAMGAKQTFEAKKELAAKWRQLTQAERRIGELDRLSRRIYGDNANKLSDSRFQMLSDDYEREQEELREKLL